MDRILAKIKEIILVPMSEMDITIDQVEYVCENNYNFLKITLDKASGIDLDTIVEATNIINPLIDKQDLIKEEFILDISSKERGKL